MTDGVPPVAAVRQSGAPAGSQARSDGDGTPAADRHRPPTATRRGVLAAAGTGLAGAAGCLGTAREPVTVLAAGSLLRALTGDFESLVDPELEVETYGSARCARLVAAGQRDPDLLVLADEGLFESVVGSPWYALFASNALVLAHRGEAADRLAGAEPWVRPLVEGTVTLGRTDPDLDPLGYRTLFALQLAAARHDRPDLSDQVLAPDQTYPETELLAQLETGGVDAAFVYRSMAVERDYDFRDLPTAVDLSDPALVDRYRAASYTLPDGTVVRGDVIRYGATLRRRSDRTESVFEALVARPDDYLADHGFVVRDAFPTYGGDVPDGLPR